MRCFIIGTDGHGRASEVLQAAGSAVGTEPVGLADLATLRADRRLRRGGRALVVIADTPSSTVSIGDAIGFAAEHAGDAFVVWLAETISPDDLRALVRTGAADWLTWTEYAAGLSELARRLTTADASHGAGKVVSFRPSKGGVGNTSLLVEAATAIAKRRGDAAGTVAILDLNLQGGTLADALDVEPRLDLREIVSRPDRLDEQLVDVFASRTDGMDVFAGPFSQIELETVRPETVFALLDTLAGRYETIFLDLPNVSLPWTDNLLRGSDVVIVTGGESIPALRLLAATLGHLDTLGIARGQMAAVVNGVEVDLLGRCARRSLIERALAGYSLFMVRKDSARFAEALDVGRPLRELGRGSRVSGDIAKLTDWVRGAAVGRDVGTRT